MSVEILEGDGKAVFFCNTDMEAFGPVMDDCGVYTDAVEAATTFEGYVLNDVTTDIRQLKPGVLMDRWESFKTAALMGHPV